jgi:hypothetical protein
MYDDGYECIVSSEGFMSFRHYHDDGDLFAFGTLIFAPEISTIFIVDIYGFNFHSFEDQTEFYNMDELEENTHCIDRDTVYDVLSELFPAYTICKFGYDELTTAKDDYLQSLTAQAPILANVLPSLVIKEIARHQLPKWVSEPTLDPFLPPITDPSDHRSAFAHFLKLSLNPVSAYIDALDA